MLPSKIRLSIAVTLISAAQLILAVNFAFAQPTAPDRDYLYLEDKLKKERKDKGGIESKELQKKRKDFEGLEKGGKLPFDVNAKSITFDSAGNKIIADGGVIITYSTIVLEAVKGVVNLDTNVAQVSGDVRLTDSTGDISADSARINLKDGTGVLENADVNLSAGQFKLHGKEVEKKAEERS